MKERLAVVAVVLLGLVGTAALVIGVLLISNRQDRTCQVLRDFVDRSNATLPTLAYYRQHPGELRAALKTNREFLRALDFCKSPHRPKAQQASPRPKRAPRKRQARPHPAQGGASPLREHQLAQRSPSQGPAPKRGPQPGPSTPATPVQVPPASASPAPSAPATSRPIAADTPDAGIPPGPLGPLCETTVTALERPVHIKAC
jgi:hypothetical protein